MLENIELFLLDMDGTLYLGDEVIDGAIDFVHRIAATHRRYMYLTNNSSRAGSDYIDRLRGLGLGADDYMVKPFLPQELLLRVSNILRRYYKEEPATVELAGSTNDFARDEVIKDGERLPLTAKEYAILQALCRNAGRIVTIDGLCEAAWGDNPYGYENSLMAHIRRIREKIEKSPSKPVSLLTVKGLGYKLILK